MKKLVGFAIVVVVVVLAVWYAVAKDDVVPGGSGADSPATPADVDAGSPAADPSLPAGARPARAEVDVPAAPPRNEAPVVVRLVDAETGEPVPHLRVELVPESGAHEVLVSDATGLVTSRETWPAGAFEVRLVGNAHPDDILQTSRREAKAVPTSVRHEHLAARDAAPVELAIPVGPTFPLRVTFPTAYDAEDLLAVYTSADPRQAFDKLYCVPRLDDGGPWVRFSPLASLVGGRPELIVRLGTADGLWHGSAEVAATVGIQPPLAIELRSTGAVRGRVLDPAGEPVARQWVVMKRTDPPVEGAPAPRPLLALTDEDGRYFRRWMEPGPHSFTIEREGCVTYEADITVALHLPTVMNVRLEADGVARDGTIRGRVTSATGAYTSDVLVILVQPAEPGWNRTTDVAWAEENGVQVGRFAFDELADGDYLLAFHASDLAELDPPQLTLSPSDEELEFLVHEPAPASTTALVFRAKDAATGEVLTAYEPFLDVNPGTPAHRGEVPDVGEDGRAVWPDYPVDTPFTYMVSCTGYQPAWGDEGDAQPEGEDLVIDVALDPGWGTRVVVFGPDAAPLAGAAVSFDGVEAGVTDAAGELRVVLPATPRRVRVALDGWRMTDDDGSDPHGIAFRAWQRFLAVRMVRGDTGPVPRR